MYMQDLVKRPEPKRHDFGTATRKSRYGQNRQDSSLLAFSRFEAAIKYHEKAYFEAIGENSLADKVKKAFNIFDVYKTPLSKLFGHCYKGGVKMQNRYAYNDAPGQEEQLRGKYVRFDVDHVGVTLYDAMSEEKSLAGDDYPENSMIHKRSGAFFAKEFLIADFYDPANMKQFLDIIEDAVKDYSKKSGQEHPPILQEIQKAKEVLIISSKGPSPDPAPRMAMA